MAEEEHWKRKKIQMKITFSMSADIELGWGKNERKKVQGWRENISRLKSHESSIF
jgi:hypothetical protein